MGVTVNELIRANPSISSASSKLPASTKLFLPPCINGVLQGTKVQGAAVAMALDQSMPLGAAVAAAKETAVAAAEPAESA